MRRLTVLALFLLPSLLVPAVSNALITPTECLANEVDGKVGICHRTNSAVNPYKFLEVAVESCIEGHSGHEEDFIAIDENCADIVGP